MASKLSPADLAVARWLIAPTPSARNHFIDSCHDWVEVIEVEYDFDTDWGWSEFTPGDGGYFTISADYGCECGVGVTLEFRGNCVEDFEFVIRGIADHA